jgi:hypothetical protein
MKTGVLVVAMAIAAVALGLAMKQCDGGKPPSPETKKIAHQ